MSESQNGRMPKFEPPERVQITVEVSPEVKRRLEWVAEQIGWSITKILEHSAANKERIVLADLKPEHREAYLAGTLDLATAFPGKRIRRSKFDVPDEVAVVSAMITSEARRRLDLYSRLTQEPLAIVDREARRQHGAAPQEAPAARSRARSATRSVDGRAHDAGRRGRVMNIAAQPPRLISVRRAAWLIGRKKSAIWHAILDGRLRGIMIDGRYRIDYADLDAMIRDAGGERLEDILDKGRLP